MYQYILASGSPRRKELLEQIGLSFSILPSTKEEVINTQIPEELVSELAFQKAMDIATQSETGSIIIGADTIVCHNEKILGKPKNKEEAVLMIEDLQGHCHDVYTGVCIIIKEKDEKITISKFCENTKVEIGTLTREEIIKYVATGEPLDKAGAYAIQGKFAKYVNRIIGDYYNVVGFPLSRFCKELKNLGIEI